MPVERYEVIRHIQAGSTANVYLAKDTSTKQLVALKKMSITDHGKLSAEVAAQRAVHHHSNIATVYDFSFNSATGEATVAMEFCERDLIDVVPPNVGLKPQQAAAYVMQIADAVAHMHAAGYAHRDIKCENICLTGEKAKIIDFGMAHDLSQPLHSRRMSGTECYMAPELFNRVSDGDNTDLDLKAADVWSLGIVLFGLLTGRFPWTIATVKSTEFCQYIFGRMDAKQTSLWARIPGDFQPLLRSMLCVRPGDRVDMLLVHDTLKKLVDNHAPAQGA